MFCKVTVVQALTVAASFGECHHPPPKALTLTPKPQQLLLFVSKQLHFQSNSEFSPVPYSSESRFFPRLVFAGPSPVTLHAELRHGAVPSPVALHAELRHGAVPGWARLVEMRDSGSAGPGPVGRTCTPELCHARTHIVVTGPGF